MKSFVCRHRVGLERPTSENKVDQVEQMVSDACIPIQGELFFTSSQHVDKFILKIIQGASGVTFGLQKFQTHE